VGAVHVLVFYFGGYLDFPSPASILAHIGLYRFACRNSLLDRSIREESSLVLYSVPCLALFGIEKNREQRYETNKNIIYIFISFFGIS